jgi:hypothetical protein
MIKKYQNSGTIKISPEREAEIRAEQQAALDDL